MSIQEPSQYNDTVAGRILDAAFIVHRELGPGLLESIYEICMTDLLTDWGFKVERQKPFVINFMNKKLDSGFKADLVVNNAVIVELKSVEKLIPVHDAQILTYLKLSDIQLGLLLNFNVPLLKQGIKRFVLSQSRGERGVRGG
ncbi:MAG: GxxExxY protein [Micavibrio aeruginosavorus]|uniref:GxxExxY protein n=1 Tax=Micavibrio aeruginosavorus TaxID=349221 RepID=A0A7T5R0N4_9BACT|nr:MAG: GxxExxY protein [Micavibrio aeruginosavorus]